VTAVVASILTGIFALAGSLITYLVQGRQQRALAQDERLWSRQAETYVAMLQYQGSGMIEGYHGAATAKEWAVRDELTAKAAAFASDEVRKLWQESALASYALNEYVSEEWPQWNGGAEGFAIEDDMEKDPEFRRFRQASTEAGKQLAEQIRTELDIRRRGRRRHSRRGRDQGSLPASSADNPAGKLPSAGSEAVTNQLPPPPPSQP
jgi:hypothetical protein